LGTFKDFAIFFTIFCTHDTGIKPITIETGPVCGSEELRNNIEFVMTAVRTQNGLSLKLASEEPRRKDKKIVMTAVTQNGLCLILASEELVRNTRLSWLQ